MFEEALSAHQEIDIPNCHWAYKIYPMTITRVSNERDFFFMAPHDFCKQARPEDLEKGLLQKFEFRENDKHISAIKLTFSNGTEKFESPAFGQKLFLDKSI